jgi:hypothetical protein
MRKPLTLCLLMAVLPGAPAAEPTVTANLRTSLVLTDEEKAAFLVEMRQMLASIQGIVAGIGSEDREAIAAAARLSGNRMARAMPATVRAKQV